MSAAAAIKERIESEIEGIDSNEFGWHFRPYLLELPQLTQMKEHDGGMCQVWVVLREKNDGYSVVFDPEVGEFGLATGGTIVGIYGGFLETLNAI